MKSMLALLLVLFSGAVAAQPYVVGSLGKVADSEMSLALGVGIGYQMSRHFAAEIAYVDPGEVSSTATTSTDLRAARVSLVGAIPVGRFSVLGSVSAYRMQASFTEPAAVTSASATVPGVGLGVGYRVADSVELRAMAESVKGKDDLFGAGKGLGSIRSLGLSLLYRF